MGDRKGKKDKPELVAHEAWDGSSLLVPVSLLITVAANGPSLLAAANGEVHLITALIRFLATEAIALGGVSLLWWLYQTMGATPDAPELDDEVITGSGATADLSTSADATPRRRATDAAPESRDRDGEQVGASR